MKKSKKITYKEYSDLVPAMAAYRRNLMAFSDITTQDYGRLFTERRVAGGRTKFWLGNFTNEQIKLMKRYVAEFPFVFAGKGKVYEVSLKQDTLTGSYGISSDYRLVFTAK